MAVFGLPEISNSLDLVFGAHRFQKIISNGSWFFTQLEINDDPMVEVGCHSCV